MSLYPGLVLDELYFARHEGLLKGGWIGVHTVLDMLNRSLDVFPRPGFTDVVQVLEDLMNEKLVEQDRYAPDFWRIASCFYADLDEWGERVMEALVANPGWHSEVDLRRLVLETRHIELSATMVCVFLTHLYTNHRGRLQHGLGRVRIRTWEWLKRCQIQAPSS